MEVSIMWNEGSYQAEVEQTESALYKEVAKNLVGMSIPNTVKVTTPIGNIQLDVKKRGTFWRDEQKVPSMYVTKTLDTIEGLEPSVYAPCYLTCVSSGQKYGNYKFYKMSPGDSGIAVEYGRIGAKKGEPYGPKETFYGDTSLYWIRYYEKLSKDYVDSSSVYLTPVKKKSLVKGAGPSADLYRLLSAFAQNTINENYTAPITKGMISESKKIYRQLIKRKTVRGFNNQLKKLFAVSPRKLISVSAALADSTEDFPDIIEREESLLMAMDVVEATEGSFKNYNIDVFEATKEQTEKVIKMLDGSLASRVYKVYRVIPKDQKKRFDDYLKDNNISHVRELWHGSRNCNWLSIMKNGLQLNPAAQITGKMFGNGIYFANSASKSWGYTSYHGSRWANGSSGTAVMGIYATAYGNPYYVDSPYRYTQSFLRGKNKDCVHAKKGRYLHCDEIIYYSEDAMLLNYIVLFH